MIPIPVVFALALVAACGLAPGSDDGVIGGHLESVAEEEKRAPTVLLISLDGTRPEDVTEDSLPSLVAFGRRGFRAAALIPAIPTNTFPNHVTLVTGVNPEEHGLVNNIFLDPERGLFKKKDIPAWIEAEPLWSILAGHGVVSASYHWVGSEGPWRSGRGPRYWKEFSSRTTEDEKVDQILAWLDLPVDAPRPRLITSWFHGGDHEGHIHGPGAPQVKRHLLRQDQAIAKLLAGLERRGLFASTTLIFVSDHGMAAPPERVDLGSALARLGIEARVLGVGGFATVVPTAKEKWPLGTTKRIVEEARALGLDAVERSRAPASAGVENVRFGEVVVTAPIERAIVRKGLRIKGFHGYDPSYPEMSAIFIAGGRGVAEGREAPAFSSLDVAPTLLNLLGVPVPESMRGKIIPVSAVERNPVARE